MANAWSFFSTRSPQYVAGRYDDKMGSHYSYDSSVPHHRLVGVSDLAVLRDSDTAFGAGWIRRIVAELGTKDRLRCPACGHTGIKERRTLAPRYRCDRRGCHNVFDTPVVTTANVIRYRAEFDGTWRTFTNPIPTKELRAVYLRHSPQHAIIRADFARLRDLIESTNPRGERWWRLGGQPDGI